MRLSIVFLTFFILLSSMPARALESPWRSADHVQIRLVSASDSIGADGVINAALEVRLEDGWHAYWRMAGDGGLPPTLDWKGSNTASDVVVDWPTPERSETAGLQSFGYTGLYALPLTAKVESGKEAKLAVKAEIMVCHDICIPQSLEAELAIPAGDGKEGLGASLVEKARHAVPAKGDLPALKIESAVVGPDALVVNAWSANGFDGADLFAEPAELVLYAKPEITVDAKDKRKAVIKIAKSSSDPDANLAKETMGKTLVLTLVTKDGAIEKSYPF